MGEVRWAIQAEDSVDSVWGPGAGAEWELRELPKRLGWLAQPMWIQILLARAQ